MTESQAALTSPGIDLYWIPLGAGAHLVRISGGMYEAIAARIQRRARCELYHSALIVATADGSFVIEMTPITDGRGPQDRGVVSEGAVGVRWARRLRVFRYEIHRWRGGVIPDIAQAVASPVRVTSDAAMAQQVLDLVPSVPTPTWGRDELRAGDMWNSNSVVAWLLARTGLDAAAGRPPPGGRAPGWDAGIVTAQRSVGRASLESFTRTCASTRRRTRQRAVRNRRPRA